jgi:hypothetical protein
MEAGGVDNRDLVFEITVRRKPVPHCSRVKHLGERKRVPHISPFSRCRCRQPQRPGGGQKHRMAPSCTDNDFLLSRVDKRHEGGSDGKSIVVE